MNIEQHPLEPFLPENAQVLMLGSFPPQRKRWSMEFYYPNWNNDMWRITGLIFFGDKEHFVDKQQKRFDRERLEGDNRTEPVPVNLPAGEYDLLVVTNTGDIRSSLQGKTLGGIRDYLLTSAWQEKGGAYSHFVMTSDGHTDDTVTLCGNPKEEPANATVEVERVAARIDYRAASTLYNIVDETYGRGKATITGAVILNKMAAGSYLLKRVAAPDRVRMKAPRIRAWFRSMARSRKDLLECMRRGPGLCLPCFFKRT